MADLPPTRELDVTPAELGDGEKVGDGQPLTSSGLALSAGLRALAEEIPRRPVAEAIRRMAAELDRGVSLDAVLREANSDVPVCLRGLILGDSGQDVWPTFWRNWWRWIRSVPICDAGFWRH